MNKPASMQESLRIYLQAMLENMHTCIPGRIESYDSATRRATVQPTVNHWFQDGDLSAIVPPIREVPVIIPGNGIASIEWDLEKGDGCLILFSEAGIGDYLAGAGTKIIDSDDPARFQLSDAICLPWLWPFKAVPKPANKISIGKDGSILISSSTGSKVALDSAGKVALNGSAATLSQLASQIATSLSDINTVLTTFATASSASVTDPVVKAAAIALSSSLASIVTPAIAQINLLNSELFS